MVRRARLELAAGVDVEFADRDLALRQLAEIAERGTRLPLVVYGPEGCGKTALLLQARLILEEHGYHVIYADPLAEEKERMLVVSDSLRTILREVLTLMPEPFSRIVSVALDVATLALKRLGRPRIAILLDDVFQAIGLERVERLAKSLLNLIEYPPGDYDRIAVIVASSEGRSRDILARHAWTSTRLLWNMGPGGLEELYNALPGAKPGFEDVWRLTGGNPRMLAALYEHDWDADRVVEEELIAGKALTRLVARLDEGERSLLYEALTDPDALFQRLREPTAQRLEEKLVDYNLVARLEPRTPSLWLDQPPPERDPELGIGRWYAWQTPLHRAAVEKALRLVEPRP